LSAAGLREPAAAAAVGRAMMLRAELAVHTGDTQTARKWARNLADLWEHADPLLQENVARMRTLAATGIVP
jgi:hypothetical protein